MFIQTLLPLLARFWWVAIVGAALVFASVQSARLKSAQSGLAHAADQLVESRQKTSNALAERDALRGAVKRQNAALQAWKVESDAIVTKAALAVGQARRSQGIAQAEAARLTALKPTGDGCADAERMLRGLL